MAITIHQESWDNEEIENGVEEDPIDNVPLHTEIKGEDIEEPKDEISASAQSKTDQERDCCPYLVCTRQLIITDPQFHLLVILKRTIKTSH